VLYTAAAKIAKKAIPVLMGMRVHLSFPPNEQSAENWRFSSMASTKLRGYLQKKDHALSEEEKEQIREQIDHGSGDVYKLAAEFHCAPIQVAGIKAARHHGIGPMTTRIKKIKPPEASEVEGKRAELATLELDRAIAEYRTAIRLHPNDAAAHYELGNSLDEEGDRDGAIAEYRTAIRLQPDHAQAHNNLGNVLHQEGDLDGAIAEWRTAIRLHPHDAVAHYDLGRELWTKGDREAAFDEFHAAYRLAPNEPTIRQIYYNLMRQLER